VRIRAKWQLRADLLAARRNVADAVRASEAQVLCRRITTLANSEDTVCAYVPIGSEPGSIDMLDALLQQGTRVLLPVARVTPDGTPRPLLWGEYAPGKLVAARMGLLEPAEPWLPESALTEASLVLVPALAVDRRGVRLGRGAGYYDRSLGLRDPAARLVAVVRDDELVDELPHEPHDVRMTHALTPAHGLVTL
jgi:5-formyltetrahydrofolate cyclo-ligase